MIQIPAFLVYLSAVGVLFLVGGLINSVYMISKRMAKQEADAAELRHHIVRLEGILYDMNPGAFKH